MIQVFEDRIFHLQGKNVSYVFLQTVTVFATFVLWQQAL